MDRAKLLPKLRHELWKGWTELPSRPLLELPVKGLPRIGVGEDTPKRYTFVQHQDLADGASFADLERIAIANLAKRAEYWTVKEKSKGLLGLGSRPTRLELVAESATERVLDVTFMTKAHELLGAELLLIAMPVRGILWARAAPRSVEETAAFIGFARHAFEHGPHGIEPLTPIVLSVQGGAVVGVVSGAGSGGGPIVDEDIVPAQGFPWPVQGEDENEDGADESGEPDVDDERRRLHRVGYDAASKTVEYACYVEPGEAIPDVQVKWIAHLVEKGEISKRHPVDVVRISCPDRRVAEQIAPQIRPTGAQIIFMSDAGEDEIL